MAYKRRIRGRSTRSRSGKLVWDTVVVGPTQIAAGISGVTDLVGGFANDEVTKATVMRIRGQYAARQLSSDVNMELQVGVWTQRLEAEDAGVAPEMEQDDFAYLWRDTLYGRIGSTTGTNQEFIQREIDVKSKRKFRSAQDSQLQIQFENTSAATTLEYVFTCRTLLWIP